LEEVFKGNKALFEGLYIYDKIDWKQHPVIRLDFGGRTYDTSDDLKISLTRFVDITANNYQITLEEILLPDKFGELIRKLHLSSGQQVVVLIDEYDKPITDHLTNQEVMAANKTVLHNFYQVLKAVDEHLHFVFLTGVSKFSGVSIFSGLNNLRDITLSEEYATICGYTQSELEHYFAEYIDLLSKHFSLSREYLLNEIRTWYNGYSWDGENTVYNPFSTLLFFAEKQFDNYWFRTGTPAFLIEVLRKRNRLATVLQPTIANSNLFEGFDPVNISETSLLFQTGYLTIKKKEIVLLRPQYTLDIPNMEVRESLLGHLLCAYSNYPIEEESGLKNRMLQHLLTRNAESMEQNIREMLAYIPYPLHIESEAYYHSLLLLWLRMLGFDIEGEIMTNAGRIDAVWKTPEHIVIADVKFQAKKGKIAKLLDKALQQIKEKQYVDKYNDGQKVILLAVAFAGQEIGCRIEDYQ
jgi:hypothetical protein